MYSAQIRTMGPMQPYSSQSTAYMPGPIGSFCPSFRPATSKLEKAATPSTETEDIRPGFFSSAHGVTTYEPAPSSPDRRSILLCQSVFIYLEYHGGKGVAPDAVTYLSPQGAPSYMDIGAATSWVYMLRTGNKPRRLIN